MGSPISSIRATASRSGTGISGVIGRNSNIAFTYPLDVRMQQIARLYRGDARGRSGHDDVPRMQRVHRRGELDQPLDVVDEILRVRILSQLAVYPDREIEVVGIADLVGGREPGPEHAVGIDRLAEALQLRPAHSHVQADRVGADVLERFFPGDLVAALADHERELDLVVVATLGPAQANLLAEADQRGIRLEEQAPVADALLDVGAAVRDSRRSEEH